MSRPTSSRHENVYFDAAQQDVLARRVTGIGGIKTERNMQRDSSFDEKQNNIAMKRGMTVKDATRAQNNGIEMDSINMDLIDQNKLFESESEHSSSDQQSNESDEEVDKAMHK